MYRIQVAENSMPTDGKFVEIVGSYNPTAADQPLEVKKDRVEYWISKGAKPTNTVARLLNKVGFDLPVEQGNKAPKKKAKAKSEEVKVAPVAEAVKGAEVAEVDQNNNEETVATEETPPVEVGTVVPAEEQKVEDAEPVVEAPKNDETEAPAENNTEEAEASQEEQTS